MKRIAIAGDWHANYAWARTAIEHAAAQGAEVIVHLGDFGYAYTRNFINAIDRTLRLAGVELWFIDGNHENFPRLHRHPIIGDGRRALTDRLFHLPRGYRWQWNGVAFLALGGAHSVDRPWRIAGTSWWPEEHISDDQVQAAIAGGPADVLIAHDAPSGVTIPGIEANTWIPPLELLRAEEHRRQVDKVVDAVQPREIWHGHYHVAYEAVMVQPWGPVMVHGLDCDGTTLDGNMRITTIGEADNGDGPQVESEAA